MPNLQRLSGVPVLRCSQPHYSEWVAYSGNEIIARAASMRQLILMCERQGLTPTQYELDVFAKRPSESGHGEVGRAA